MWQKFVNFCFAVHAKRIVCHAVDLWLGAISLARKTNVLCDVVHRPIDSRIVKIFSFKGSRLFAVRLSSVVCCCIEIWFEIVNGMVPNISTERQWKIPICFGRCFEIIYKADSVCFHNLAVTRVWLIHLSNIFTLPLNNKPWKKAEKTFYSGLYSIAFT